MMNKANLFQIRPFLKEMKVPMSSALSSHSSRQRLERILNPANPLVREDVVWVLEYVKKKVAEQDPRLLGLPQPRLLRNFQYFADAATLLIKQRPGWDHEAERLRNSLAEAVYGLYPDETEA
jgi:hypothetical protein